MYDVIIVGSGCSGYAAAMYAGRLNLKTLLIGKVDGGMITLTDVVENYPGFISLTGLELAERIKNHASQYNIEMLYADVLGIEKNSSCFNVKTKSKAYTSKAIIFATGTESRKLNIPGEKEFQNHGVHSCALCDGVFYKNKAVAVIGGSDSAAKEAILLTQWAKKVHIIYRGSSIHPEPVNMQRINALSKKGKIEIMSNANVKSIKGTSKVTSIALDKKYKGSNDLKLDAVFIDIGHIPKSSMAKKLGVKLNSKSEVIINRESATNIPGFFAAGDVTDTKFKQAITGISEAVTAAYSAYQYISNNIIMPCNDEESRSRKVASYRT